MMNVTKNHRKSKGLVIWLTVIALPFFLMITGLALDSGRAYLVKAKLFAALDAVGIAAARAVAMGNLPREQRQTNISLPTFQPTTSTAIHH